jgi:hypothetical protein
MPNFTLLVIQKEQFIIVKHSIMSELLTQEYLLDEISLLDVIDHCMYSLELLDVLFDHAQK